MKTLQELYESEGFVSFKEDMHSNMAIDDPDRFERVMDGVENGEEGSTHGEIIQDWEDYLFLGNHDISSADEANILVEIKACRNWHHTNGSLSRQVL